MKDFWDYIVKNKYVIICVSIVVVLYAIGIVEFLAKAVILVALIGVAVFIGKKLQDNEFIIKNIFEKAKGNMKNEVYYYQEKNNNKEE